MDKSFQEQLIEDIEESAKLSTEFGFIDKDGKMYSSANIESPIRTAYNNLRGIDQIINEGNAIIKVKDNEIERLKYLDNENERLSKIVDQYYDAKYNYDRRLRIQYCEKNSLKERIADLELQAEKAKNIIDSKKKECEILKTHSSEINQIASKYDRQNTILMKDLNSQIDRYNELKEKYLNLEFKSIALGWASFVIIALILIFI